MSLLENPRPLYEALVPLLDVLKAASDGVRSEIYPHQELYEVSKGIDQGPTATNEITRSVCCCGHVDYSKISSEAPNMSLQMPKGEVASSASEHDMTLTTDTPNAGERASSGHSVADGAAEQSIAELQRLGCDLLSNLLYLRNTLHSAGIDFDNDRTSLLVDRAHDKLHCRAALPSHKDNVVVPDCQPKVPPSVAQHGVQPFLGASLNVSQPGPSFPMIPKVVNDNDSIPSDELLSNITNKEERSQGNTLQSMHAVDSANLSVPLEIAQTHSTTKSDKLPAIESAQAGSKDNNEDSAGSILGDLNAGKHDLSITEAEKSLGTNEPTDPRAVTNKRATTQTKSNVPAIGASKQDDFAVSEAESAEVPLKTIATVPTSADTGDDCVTNGPLDNEPMKDTSHANADAADYTHLIDHNTETSFCGNGSAGEYSKCEGAKSSADQHDIGENEVSQGCFIPEEEGNGSSHVFILPKHIVLSDSSEAGPLVLFDDTLTNFGKGEGTPDPDLTTSIHTLTQAGEEAVLESGVDLNTDQNPPQFFPRIKEGSSLVHDLLFSTVIKDKEPTTTKNCELMMPNGPSNECERAGNSILPLLKTSSHEKTIATGFEGNPIKERKYPRLDPVHALEKIVLPAVRLSSANSVSTASSGNRNISEGSTNATAATTPITSPKISSCPDKTRARKEDPKGYNAGVATRIVDTSAAGLIAPSPNTTQVKSTKATTQKRNAQRRRAKARKQGKADMNEMEGKKLAGVLLAGKKSPEIE